MSTNILDSKELRPLVHFAEDDADIAFSDGVEVLELAIARLTDTTKELQRRLDDYRNISGNSKAKRLFDGAKYLEWAANDLHNHSFNDMRGSIEKLAGQMDILAKMYVRLEHIAESESK